MNTELFKYVVEIAKYQSINKAADSLFVSQSNLSRDLKRLEEELGYKIFKRTNKGVIPTNKGQVFLSYAYSILKDLNAIDEIKEENYRQLFSISVPKATYISEAFTEFVQKLDPNQKMLISFKETSSVGALDEITLNDFKLGIIRYQESFASLIAPALETRHLVQIPLKKFEYVVALSKDDPLANKEVVTTEDIKDYIELTHGDPYIPNFSDNSYQENSLSTNKKIRIYDSMGQLKMINSIPHTFMIIYPLTDEAANQYNIVQKRVEGISVPCVDMLVRHKDYKYSYIDTQFLQILLSK